MDCVFCDILAGKRPVSMVYQDDRCSAFMDIQPVNPGHVLVVPNEHLPSLSSLNADVGGHIFRVAQRVAAALRTSSTIHCEGIDLFLADGESAGQEVLHVHLHVIPRFQGDGFGFRFPAHYEAIPGRSRLDSIAKSVRELLPVD